MKAKQENIEAGSVVFKNGEPYHVYKVNKTFIWAGKKKTWEVLSNYKGKAKPKWTDLMKSAKAEKFTYDGLEVDDSEALSPEEITKKLIKKRYLKSCCEKVLYQIKDDKEKGKGSWKNTHECPVCGTRINPVKFEGENNLLISSGGKMFYFNFNNGKYFFFKDIY